MRHARSGKLGGLAVRTQTAGTLWAHTGWGGCWVRWR